MPAKGHALGAEFRMSAQTASLKSLRQRLRQLNEVDPNLLLMMILCLEGLCDVHLLAYMHAPFAARPRTFRMELFSS